VGLLTSLFCPSGFIVTVEQAVIPTKSTLKIKLLFFIITPYDDLKYNATLSGKKLLATMLNEVKTMVLKLMNKVQCI
jgi:hypothetical protein